MGLARFGLLLALIQVALAQSQPDVAEILKKVSDTYGAAKEFELIAEATGQAARTRLAAFRWPDRYRMEGTDIDGKGIVVVGNGSSMWVYSLSENQYFSIASKDNGARGFGEMVDSQIGRFRTAGDAAPRARFLREETIEVNGQKLACFVVTLPVSIPQVGASTHTWWIEEKSSHVVRDEYSGGKVVFTTIKLNEPLPDDLFKFVPPPGARKTEGN